MKTIAPTFLTWRRATGRVPPGEARGFHDLILPHVDGAYNLARYLTCDPVVAEDVVQDALVRAFRNFSQFRGSSPRAWLFTIVRNCCRTTQARTLSRVSLVVHESALGDEAASMLGEHPDPSPNPEEQLLRNADIHGVRKAIEAIPEPFREAIVLRELEGLAYSEIAEVTGVPIGTVMSRLARGRATLASQLLPASLQGDDQSRSVK